MSWARTVGLQPTTIYVYADEASPSLGAIFDIAVLYYEPFLVSSEYSKHHTESK